MKKIKIGRSYDIRPIDYRTGKREPIGKDQMKQCACCGKLIAKVTEVGSNDVLGSECVESIETMNRMQIETKEQCKRWYITPKQFAYFQAHAQ